MDIMLQLLVFLTNNGGSRIEANLGTPIKMLFYTAKHIIIILC